MLPAGLEDDEVPTAIDIEVEQRVSIAVNITDLSSQIENVINIPDRFLHHASIADVAFDEIDFVRDGLQIEGITSVQWKQRVNNAYFGA